MFGCKKWSGSCSLCPFAGYEPCPDEVKELLKEMEKDMGKKIFSINVPGRHGYSFGVACDCSYDEESVIDLALENNLFEEDCDADYAIAEDITDSEYDLLGLRDVTYEL